MSDSGKSAPLSAIVEAIRAKRERRSRAHADIAELEASLIADIDTFDLDAAERKAKREYLVNSGTPMHDLSVAFPDVAPARSTPKPADSKPPEPPVATPPSMPEAPPRINSSLLDQLRQRAEIRQREIHSALAERSSVNVAIDQSLKDLFFYLHELVQQLNILKPEIPRNYPLIEQFELNQLAWQEGFADFRTQTQSAGALVDLVSFSYHLSGTSALHVERDGPTVERFRTMLFNYGLPFTCKEFKNDRHYVERAEFEIRSEISVSARWRADFAKGLINLETRNLERLGSAIYSVPPHAVDKAMLDSFGLLVLGQTSDFRALVKRQ